MSTETLLKTREVWIGQPYNVRYFLTGKRKRNGLHKERAMGKYLERSVMVKGGGLGL